MKETTFERARTGDKVWTKKDGWGSIVRIDDNEEYPIVARFENRWKAFNLKGFALMSDKHQSLFWDELKIPTRPKKKVIKKVERWANIYPYNLDDDNIMYKTKEAANRVAGDARIACVKLTGKYEVEE